MSAGRILATDDGYRYSPNTAPDVRLHPALADHFIPQPKSIGASVLALF